MFRERRGVPQEAQYQIHPKSYSLGSQNHSPDLCLAFPACSNHNELLVSAFRVYGTISGVAFILCRDSIIPC